IRRAVRFAKEIGIDRPFMFELVETVGAIMKDFYPEVLEKKDFIAKMIKAEEERFHETLHEGLQMLTNILEEGRKKGTRVIPGEHAFRLYDTYGFPIELTKEYVEKEGFTIDENGFQKEMEKQRERARKARQKVDSMQVQDEKFANLDAESEFVGYDNFEVSTTITAIIDDEDNEKELYLLLKETPFCAESGGQIADQIGRASCRERR